MTNTTRAMHTATSKRTGASRTRDFVLPVDDSGGRRHPIAIPDEIMLPWVKRDADQIARTEHPTKTVAMFRADGEFEVEIVDADEFERMVGWGGLTLYRAIDDVSHVGANLGRRHMEQSAEDPLSIWAVWYGKGVHGDGCYFSVSTSIEYSLRGFSNRLMGGGEGWVCQFKMRQEANVITEQELEKLRDLSDIEEFPQALLPYAENGMKALLYCCDAIHIDPGEKTEQFAVLNKRVMVVNRMSLPTAEVCRKVHGGIVAAIAKKKSRAAEIEAESRPIRVRLADMERRKEGLEKRRYAFDEFEEDEQIREEIVEM